MWKRTLLFALIAWISVSARGGLVINEVCYDNATVADETGNADSDWIELFNSGPGAVNTLNYGIGDANPYEEAKGVRLPNYTIPAGGHLVIFANPDLPEYVTWTNAPDIAVAPANAVWRYAAPAAEPSVWWKTKLFSDVAWGSGIAPFGYNDPKLNLDCATVLDYGGDPANRYPTAYFRYMFDVVNPSVVTGLLVRARINDGMVAYLNGVEVMRQNMPAGAIAYGTPALAPVTTTQWTTTLLPPAGLVQGANLLAVEVHQAFASSVNFIMDVSVTALVSEQVPVVHGQFGLSREGENVHLFNSALTRIHKYDPPGFEIGEDRSYGLAKDGVAGAYRVYETPTPGLPNDAYPLQLAETLTAQVPRFSVTPGFYPVGGNVVLSTPTPGYRIVYTLDGTDPRDATTFVWSGSPVFLGARPDATSGLAWHRTNPVEISSNVPTAVWAPPLGAVRQAVVLRAIAVSADLQSCSPEARGTYFIGPEHQARTLPVFSLITNPDNLYGFVQGLFVPGKTYADSPVGYGVNRWGKPYANYHNGNVDQAWERPVHLELFEAGQPTAAVSLQMGMAMYGGGSRAIPQKTLYMMARAGEYGTDVIPYPFFPDEPATAYKRFLLRNSGNDWYGPDVAGVATMMKDAVFHEIVKGMEMAVMASRPAVAYINGEYWGLHNLRESLDKHYLATRYGLNPDNVDILMHEEDALDNDKVHVERIDGDTNSDEDYEALLDWIQANPLAVQANYQQVQTWIDVTNHADYIIAETFFGNTDWPINNCDFWRAHTNETATAGVYGDTRWRWMFYDLDVAGEEGPYFNMLTYLSSSRMTGGNEPGFLINQLWGNMGFRNSFVIRYANLLNTTFRPERTEAIIGQHADAIEPEIERHFRRWGRSTTTAQWRAAVDAALVDYCATRQSVIWGHLNAHFGLGGTGSLTVRNTDASGLGGAFVVNGMPIGLDTDGVTNRADWTGTYFRSLPTSVTAVPDPGYAFDGWVGAPQAAAARSIFVGPTPQSFAARFRPAGEPPYTPSGYEQWQLANYSEQAIVSGVVAAPDAPSGQADMSNFALYVFGMHRNDGLTDAQRRARASLSILAREDAWWIGYTRLNADADDVAYTLEVADSLEAPITWRPAEVGADLLPEAVTNLLDAATWRLEIRLAPAADTRHFRLQAVQP